MWASRSGHNCTNEMTILRPQAGLWSAVQNTKRANTHTHTHTYTHTDGRTHFLFVFVTPVIWSEQRDDCQILTSLVPSKCSSVQSRFSFPLFVIEWVCVCVCVCARTRYNCWRDIWEEGARWGTQKQKQYSWQWIHRAALWDIIVLWNGHFEGQAATHTHTDTHTHTVFSICTETQVVLCHASP